MKTIRQLLNEYARHDMAIEEISDYGKGAPESEEESLLQEIRVHQLEQDAIEKEIERRIGGEA